MLVDFERADLRFERRSRGPESRRRPGRAGYAALLAPSAASTRDRSWAVNSSSGCSGTRLVEALAHEPTLIDAQGMGVGHDDRPLDDILQFADVARPGIIAQQIERLFADPFELALPQHTQQCHLRVRRQVADLVEKDGPTVGELEFALPPLKRTGKRASFVSGSQLFYDRAGSTDKTLKLYDGHFHDLLNDLGKESVMTDITLWTDARSHAT
jgi:hypothetical protein